MLSHEMIYAKSVIYYQNKHREDYVPGLRRDGIASIPSPVIVVGLRASVSNLIR